jgi:myo-inositol 2-dehydrogenase/D-chiro-inositol 1-dehydrogenase
MTLRLGVIGTGAIGRDHMRRVRRLAGAAIVAASDIDEAVARRALDDVGVDGRVYDDGHALIRATDIDAVLVTSWGGTHEDYVLSAIEAGKPVFCEKPLATTALACRRVVDAEMRVGRRLVQVGFMRSYDQGYRELRDVIRSGTLGEVLMAHSAHRNAASVERFSTEMAVNDTLVHELDIFRFLLEDEYVSAQAIFPRRTRLAPAHLRDPQIVLLETMRGVRIDVEIFVNCHYGYDIQCAVVGETGVAHLPDPPSVSVRHEGRHATAVLADWSHRFVEAYDRELRAFLEAAPGGRVDGPSAWSGYAVAVASDACLEAQRTGAVVPIAATEQPGFYRS